jgi:acyl carrier protein
MPVDLKTRLLDFIGHEILMRGEEEPLSADEELLFSGLLDSIAVMRLVGFIEAELDRRVPAQDVTLAHFSTVSALSDYFAAQDTKEG